MSKRTLKTAQKTVRKLASKPTPKPAPVEGANLDRLVADGEQALIRLNSRTDRERERRLRVREDKLNEALMFVQDARMRKEAGVDVGTYRAYVFEQPDNRMVKACAHRHRTRDSALRCARDMTTDVRRERGITARRMRTEDVSPAQERARLAYRVGLAVSVEVRKQVNEVLREHEGHDVRRVNMGIENEDGRVELSCEDCDRTYEIGVTIEERED